MNQNERPATATLAGPEGESENATVTPNLPRGGKPVKRPGVPERPADILRRLAAKSRRWKW